MADIAQRLKPPPALIVGASTFYRLFSGVRFDEVSGEIQFVYAKDKAPQQRSRKSSPYTATIASSIKQREINIEMALPPRLVG